jgi:hypothetical protein
MKTDKLIIRIIVTFFIVLLIVILALPRNRYLFSGPLCAEKDYMKEMTINAVTKSKFQDYDNDNYPAIEFQDISTKSTFKVFFINEKSGFYDILQIGDTIHKKSGSLEISSSNHLINKPLKYDCEEKESK